jgi:hypothetical protein
VTTTNPEFVRPQRFTDLVQIGNTAVDPKTIALVEADSYRPYVSPQFDEDGDEIPTPRPPMKHIVRVHGPYEAGISTIRTPAYAIAVEFATRERANAYANALTAYLNEARAWDRERRQLEQEHERERWRRQDGAEVGFGPA